ncbi:MAG: GNAT family N-acetyltransferase [Pleurocapsa minor GSE-CHR-MK-17-07R]|jgi:N-acetylglutamate synthase-like GNAT family acetyltransferase|nr:GNAT family N-acetyltransferase [Pleurocapsa minor GSE-CHR-MK 17-07R]
MPVTIRAARAEDAETIRAMIRHETLDPTSMKWPNFVIAEDTDASGAVQVVAIGQIKPLPGGHRELGSLIVVESHRGRGLAGQVIAALEANAPRPLYLLCETKREALYARYGYQPLSVWRAPVVLALKWLVPTVLWGWRGYSFRLMVKP